MAFSYLACVALVSSFYNLPPRVLPSIQAVEGGFNGAVHRNANGSEDFGVMQVNNVWIAALSQYTRLPPAVVQDRLTNAPCFNIAAAGAILRTYINASGGDLMASIGDYHSHTPLLNRDYQIRVLNEARKLFSPSP